MKDKRPFLIAGGLALIALLLILSLSASKKAPEVRKSPLNPGAAAPTARPKIGQMSLAADKEVLLLGGTVKIYVSVLAAGKQLSGFDALVSYDKTALEYIGAQPAVEGLQLFTFSHEDYLTFTVAKKPGTAEAIDLSTSQNLLEISFKAKKAGSHNISLAPEIGKEKTAIVGGDLEIFEPSTTDVIVSVK